MPRSISLCGFGCLVLPFIRVAVPQMREKRYLGKKFAKNFLEKQYIDAFLPLEFEFDMQNF